jgi:hypothetical protein
MIQFPCKCGQLFNLTEDMAGGLVQCPRCGLLADVPTLGDLANITDDGIFKLGEAAEITDNITVADLQEAFSSSTHDAEGREKDFRPDEEHYQTIGVAKEVDAVGYAPKYDPDTGELIQPLDFKEEEPLAVVPLEEVEDGDVPLAVIPIQPTSAGPSISYANNATRKQFTPATVMLELFMPGNVVVMLFIVLLYYLADKAAGILEIGKSLFPLMPILNIPLWFILAHYGCVLEDIGPDNCDELPRPFRHLASQEDLLKPFFTVSSALFLCYFPASLIVMQEHRLGHLDFSIMLIVEFVGSFFFPAILLTTVTGITPSNLRPDRVLNLIRICGGDYLLSVGIFLLALVPMAIYIAPDAILPADVRDTVESHIDQLKVILPLSAVSVYLMHFYCWHLGLMYRAHHEEFPWLLQRHEKRRDPVMAPPRRNRRKPTG